MPWSRCCSYSVCGLCYGAHHVLKSCSLSSCFVLPFSTVISSFGEEGAGLCASRAFVCLFWACWFLSFFFSLLVSGVVCGL